MRKLSILERQVTLKDAAMSFVLRIRPYRTIDNVIDGVVLTFVDITAREAGDAAFLRMLGFAHESDVIGVKLHELIHHTRPDGHPISGRTARSARPRRPVRQRTAMTKCSSAPMEPASPLNTGPARSCAAANSMARCVPLSTSAIGWARNLRCAKARPGSALQSRRLTASFGPTVRLVKCPANNPAGQRPCVDPASGQQHRERFACRAENVRARAGGKDSRAACRPCSDRQG